MYAWEQIQKTIDYMENHLNEGMNVESLAELSGLSPFYYQRLFRRLVKKPAAEYLKLRRMAKATQELLDRDRRILDVALELGFSSHEHFTRVFKETFGMTPDEYRKNPQTLNRMTKPELSLSYTLIDEDVPLVTDGIVLEVGRRQVDKLNSFVGMKKEMPVPFIDGLGTESGVDPLVPLWERIHQQEAQMGLSGKCQGVGVTYPSEREGHFNYFAGFDPGPAALPDGFTRWELPMGECVVCAFEAENFEGLVMDALYKAQQYLFGVWLPSHKLQTESFCAERYASHSLETTAMEIWLKILK